MRTAANSYNEIESAATLSLPAQRVTARLSLLWLRVCHGPAGHLGFAPALSLENFKAAFTAPGRDGNLLKTRRQITDRQLHLKYGKSPSENACARRDINRVIAVP